MTTSFNGAAEKPGAGIPLIDLHDHLDGGLRPQTVIELARECGYSGLPTHDAAALGAWFRSAADSGSLERFLETFAHTVAVLQTSDALRRVAAEAVIDLARGGVAWAEIRMAPELCENAQLSMDAAVVAMVAGLRAGEQMAHDEGLHIESGLIVCAMRQSDRADEVAEVVRRHADSGVIGFDIAGPEAGWPPSRLSDAFARVRDAGVHITVHAGEGDGVSSIRDALELGAQRLGHGVRIIEDISFDVNGHATLGQVASEVRERQIALEVCPTSNLQTGTVASLDAHPLAVLDELGFAITINPDNRLMCGVSIEHEMSVAENLRKRRAELVSHTTPSADDTQNVSDVPGSLPAVDSTTILRWTHNAVNASFAPQAAKQRLRALLTAYERQA